MSNAWLREASNEYLKTINQLETGEVSISEVSLIRLSNIYLVASHLYYDHDISMMRDTTFDQICKQLYALYTDVDPWWKEELFTLDGLSAGTGYHLMNKYPVAIINIGTEVRMELSRVWRPVEG